MDIKCFAEYDLGIKLGQVRSVPVALGDRGEGILFVYSSQPNLDPWEEEFYWPTDTLKMAVYTRKGERLWIKDLGVGVIPGVWFTPFMTFDLDGDGADEIWFVNNINHKAPFSLNGRRLERLDPFTGDSTGFLPWPRYTENETLSHRYRYFIAGGYVHGKPVLVTCQGTYTNMFLQGWDPGMKSRWDIKILDKEPGAKSSHVCPVIDFNKDGIDEIFWGERLLSLDDGHEVFCCDRKKFHGHSDIIIPFANPEDGRMYIYTVREDHEVPGEQRVWLYDDKGKAVWHRVDTGHMHQGWIANIGDDYRKVAMAMRLNRVVIDGMMSEAEPDDYYFDAMTGDEVQLPFSGRGSAYIPLDFDGDGYHEFFGTGREGTSNAGWVIDRFGKQIRHIGGHQVRSGKVFHDVSGDQIMLFYPDECKVRVWGCPDSAESEVYKARHNTPFHSFNQHLMGTGYNHINAVISCAM
jgi:ribosomal 30S subunit maturation factor RimM